MPETRKRRWRIASTPLIFMLMLEGCARFFPSTPIPPIGVTSHGDGVAIAAVICPGEEVDAVRLLPAVSEEDDLESDLIPIWEIKRQNGAGGKGLVMFEIGSAPEGYTTTVDAGDIEVLNGTFDVEVETDERIFGIQVDVPGRLDESIYDGAEFLSRDEFVRTYSKEC